MKKILMITVLALGLFFVTGATSTTLLAVDEGPGGGGIGGNSYEVAGSITPDSGGDSIDEPFVETYSIPGPGGVGGN
jgi:hypothetical protein